MLLETHNLCNFTTYNPRNISKGKQKQQKQRVKFLCVLKKKVKAVFKKKFLGFLFFSNRHPIQILIFVLMNYRSDSLPSLGWISGYSQGENPLPCTSSGLHAALGSNAKNSALNSH